MNRKEMNKKMMGGLVLFLFGTFFFGRGALGQTRVEAQTPKISAVAPVADEAPKLYIVPEVPQALTTRISVAANGTEGDGNSFTPAISTDGHWAAFVSGATNLAGVPTNGFWQVHLKNLQSGAVTLASVSSAGMLGNGHALDPALSGDGRFVAFESVATNLVTGTVNAWVDVFVHDTVTLSTTLISVATDGTPGNAASENATLSGDGRYVVFQSNANNLVGDDFSPYTDIFVRDRDVDEDGVFDEPDEVLTLRVSQNVNGVAANGVSTDPSISANGRWLVFTSSADNLVAGDTNSADDIFLYDRDVDNDGVFDEPGAIGVTLISAGISGLVANGFSANPVISADGTQVAFESFATDLVAGGTTVFRQHIFVRNWQAGFTVLVSQSSGWSEGDDWSQNPTISADGRWIGFESQATNLVPNDTNFGQDIFVRDRDADGDGVFDEFGQTVTARVSVDSAGGQMDGGQASAGAVSGDGNRIVFEADANDLVPGDNNFSSDVFLYQQSGSTGADLALAYVGERAVLGTSGVLPMSLQNLGPELATNVLVAGEVFGERLFFYSWLAPSQGTCGLLPDFSGEGCVFGEVPSGSTVNFSILGAVAENAYQVYQGSMTVVLEATSTTSDPAPVNNNGSFTTHFYACSAEDGCVLDEVVCYLFQNPPIALPESLGGFIPNLAMYYHLRDEILTSPTGRAYTDLYYAHSDEVKMLVFAEPNLWDLALDGLFQWEPNFTALVGGHGEMAVITAAQMQAVDDFLVALSAAGSPELQQAIAEERAKLPPFENFIGMTMEEARGAVVGYAVYLPEVQR